MSTTSHAASLPDPTDELAKLGLTLDDIEHALRRGDAERRMCTDFDPPSLPSWLQWGRTVSGLRESLVPRQWEMDNTDNVPRTVHPSGRFAMVVNTGDEGTGDLDSDVSTKYRRGPVSRKAVQVNGQLVLFEAAGFDSPTGERSTWFLLVHCTTDQMRSELSLPRTVDEDGRITAWAQRIPLPPFAHEGLDVDDDDDDEGPDFDVPVARR